ncbi:MAG: hypothetical protein ACTSXC_02285 [Candidatus Freyarchaeota archaeon]
MLRCPEVELDSIKSALQSVFSDPVVSRLLASSNLTKIQFETLMIHFLLDENVGRRVRYSLKGLMRSSRFPRGGRKPKFSRGVSKGAFRRVLGQACRNVIKSIYTLVLLGYVGLLDTPNLFPYLELSNIVSSYREQLERGDLPLHLRKLEESLVKMIEQYAEPFRLVSAI